MEPWRIGEGETERSSENGCFGGSLRSARVVYRGGETRKMVRFNGAFVSWIGHVLAGGRGHGTGSRGAELARKNKGAQSC